MNESYFERLEKNYSSRTPSIRQARELQNELRDKIIPGNRLDKINFIAGADLAILKRERKMVCGVVVFSYPELKVVEKAWSLVDEKFPYIPGLLAFREGPAIIKTYRKLNYKSDLLILDGHGIAHPRFFGIACHVGVLLDIPCYGVAKKKLFGNYEEPGNKKGAVSDLVSPGVGRLIGKVLRTRDGIKPVFISTGNRIDIETALEITLKCDSGFRIPEPTRTADKFVAEIKNIV